MSEALCPFDGRFHYWVTVGYDGLQCAHCGAVSTDLNDQDARA